MKLNDAIEQYITYRQSLGYKFKSSATALRCFVKYLNSDLDLRLITEQLTTAYLYSPHGIVTRNWFLKHSALKCFFEWAIARNLLNSMPLTSIMPKYPEPLQPYIYSNYELKSIFRTAGEYKMGHMPIPPECIRMVLQITYFLGLRIHETLSLKIEDINLEESYAVIRDTKCFKSRITPFNETVKNLLINFLAWRKTQNLDQQPESVLFTNTAGLPLKGDSIRAKFRQILKLTGIKNNNDPAPRIHDLRHTFAVNRLVTWYNEGRDVQILLPQLSTFLGHVKISDTSLYLSMTDALLGSANERFERYANTIIQ